MSLCCFKCGVEEGVFIPNTRKVSHRTQIIKHHKSYNPEIVVDCCLSCHKKIHYNLRKSNKCALSVRDIKRLSTNSSHRRTTQRIDFYETLQTNIYLRDICTYNISSGGVSCGSYFIADHNEKIYTIKE